MENAIYAGVTTPDYSVENGVYPARLFQIIQIGSHRFEKNGKEWYSPQILLGFELPTLTYENMDGVKLSTIKSGTYFLSMNPSRLGVVGLREIIDGLRGSSEYTQEELQKFNIASFLGRMCYVKLESVESKGREYQNITEIRPMSKEEMPELDPEVIPRKEILVTVNDFKNLDALDLPQWIQDKITSSSEYAEMEEKKDQPEFTLPTHPDDEDGINIDDLEL